MQSFNESLKYFQLQEENKIMASGKRTKSTKNSKRKAERLSCISKDLYEKPVSKSLNKIPVRNFGLKLNWIYN